VLRKKKWGAVFHEAQCRSHTRTLYRDKVRNDGAYDRDGLRWVLDQEKFPAMTQKVKTIGAKTMHAIKPVCFLAQTCSHRSQRRDMTEWNIQCSIAFEVVSTSGFNRTHGFSFSRTAFQLIVSTPCLCRKGSDRVEMS
jgi:hypothetical protein